VTQNETSNGTAISMERLAALREKTQGLLAVDATSSMAGVFLDFRWADVWYASVQKCFGLPAGMAVMVLSPSALKRAEKIADHKHYNSLLKIVENWEKNQAPYTPNVLGLYLLYRSQERSKKIKDVQKKVEKKFQRWEAFFEENQDFSWLVDNASVRSRTVLTLKYKDPTTLLQRAQWAGLVMGKGYGGWKETTFRIANFPAIKDGEIDKLMNFLKRY
jgi:phosphoserine aminotransferase